MMIAAAKTTVVVKNNNEPKYESIQIITGDDDEEKKNDDNDADHEIPSIQPLPRTSYQLDLLSMMTRYCCHTSLIVSSSSSSAFSYTVSSFLRGQIIAIIVTSMNTSSYLLVSKHQVQTKFFQLFFVYLFLVLFHRNYRSSNTTIGTPTNTTYTSVQTSHCSCTTNEPVATTTTDCTVVAHTTRTDNSIEEAKDTVVVADTTARHNNNNVESPSATTAANTALQDDHNIRNYQRNTIMIVNNTNNNIDPVTCHNISTEQCCCCNSEPLETDHSIHRTTTKPLFYSYTIPFPGSYYCDCSNRGITSFQLRIPIQYYCFISMIDIVANILSIYSFHYTSLTSTTLLGSLCIPSTMFFARILLRKVFTPIQYIGILLCIVGGCYTIYFDTATYDESNSSSIASNTTAIMNSTGLLSDATTSHRDADDGTSQFQPQQQQYIGDLMAVGAAFLYGLGDCIAEYLIKYVHRQEYLYMIGLFGMMFTIIIVPLLEYNAVKELFTFTFSSTSTDDNSVTIIDQVKLFCLFIWFIASVLVYYMIESIFLIYYDATLLNLSMQSVNLWAYMISYFINPDGVPSSDFFIALLFVVIGVCCYEMGSTQSSNNARSGGKNDFDIDIHGVDDCSQGSTTYVGGNSRNNGQCCHRCSRQPLRDSEVEIVNEQSGMAQVSYQSLVSKSP